MTADIGTKPMSLARLDHLKGLLMMCSPPTQKVEDEEKEKKKESKGEKMKSAKTSEDLLRLITAIALLNMAKGESEEEEEGERFVELWMMLAVFALGTVLLTFFFQWLWKVGVRWMRQRNALTAPVRSRPEARGGKTSGKEEKKIGEKGRSGCEQGRGENPVRLQPGCEQGRGENPVRLQPEREQGRSESSVRLRSQVRDGEPEEGSSRTPAGPADAVRPQFLPEREEEESSSSEMSGDTDSQDGMGQAVMNELQNIEREVSEIRERLRFNPPEDREDLPGPGFGVLRTQYGKVYHLSHQCPYLTNPRVGPARPSRWCPTCREVTRPRGLPPPGFPILITGYPGRFHTDSLCPHKGEAVQYSMCVRCQERIDEWAA